jgi:hypothetical protein
MKKKLLCLAAALLALCVTIPPVNAFPNPICPPPGNSCN